MFSGFLSNYFLLSLAKNSRVLKKLLLLAPLVFSMLSSLPAAAALALSPSP
jgi:hypothetical protein